MAGFLPQVDKLQALLKNEMTFKEKLDMAKMGKSRQLAETYLPLIAQSQNLEEATQIQQALITEAAKYGIDDLIPKINPMFESKKDLFKERQEIQKGQGNIRSLFNTYAGYKMKNPLDPEGPTVLVGDYINKWVEAQGPSAYLNADKLTYAIENNITNEQVEAGLTGSVQKPIIVVKTGGKSKYGGITDAEYKSYVYDTEGKIAFVDSNDNRKYDKGEELADMADPAVTKQMEQADANLNQYQAEQRANTELALRARSVAIDEVNLSLRLKNDNTLSVGSANAFVVSSIASLQKNANFVAAFEDKLTGAGKLNGKSLTEHLTAKGKEAYKAIKNANLADISRIILSSEGGDFTSIEKSPVAASLIGNITALKQELDKTIKEKPDLAGNAYIQAARDDLDFLSTISTASQLNVPLNDSDFSFRAGMNPNITDGTIPTLRNNARKIRQRVAR